MDKRVFRVNRITGTADFKIYEVGQVIKTNRFETNTYQYRVVQIDDQDVLLERIEWKNSCFE